MGLNVSQLLEYSRRMRAGQQGAGKSHKELREDGESLPLFNAVGTLLGPLGESEDPKTCLISFLLLGVVGFYCLSLPRSC